jgi:hypothetical protein
MSLRGQRKDKKMTTKAQVIRKAESLGCTVDLNSYDIAIHAPKGLLLGQDLHISAYPFDLYSKSEIWSNLWGELNDLGECQGSVYCDCEK